MRIVPAGLGRPRLGGVCLKLAEAYYQAGNKGKAKKTIERARRETDLNKDELAELDSLEKKLA